LRFASNYTFNCACNNINNNICNNTCNNTCLQIWRKIILTWELFIGAYYGGEEGLSH